MQRQCRTVIPAALSAVTRRLYTAAPPDGVPAGGFPLLLRLEFRTGSGGFGAWRVLLVVREADIVSGWAQ